MESLKDVIGIGNAVVDILSYATDKFLQENKFTKGSMTLVDLDSITKLQRSIENTMEISGGSVANSVVGVSVLGGSSSYIGKVHQDHLGAVFKGDLDSSGVILESGVSLDGSPTARCIVIITPDGERTMATYLGACLELTEDDIPIDAIRNHKVTYLEGYLFDVPNAKNAVLKAAEIAKKKGRSIALGLSDSLCVCRNRNSFRKFIEKYVNILFANEKEIVSLYQEQDVMAAVSKARSDCDIVIATIGENGSIVAEGEHMYMIDAVILDSVVDTTGAGDMYAAGFLFGMTHGYNIELCGRIGSIAAGEVISHTGGRPTSELRGMLKRML